MSQVNPFGLTSAQAAKSRIQLMDAARGLCIILMVLHHLGYDLWTYGMLPNWVLDNPVFYVVQPFFAGMFLFISGISSRFSHSNLRRGVRVLCWSVVVSLVSWLVGEPILFGVLHFLGCAMVIYGLTGKWVDRLPRWLTPILCAAGIVLTAPLLHRRFDVQGLFWLGFMSRSFASADYYPLLPWIFVFLLGTWAGYYVKERRLPDWFYTWTCPVLPQIGRLSLVIYLAHQPICYGAVVLIHYLISR